jgi:hypothetical protein
MWYGAVLRAQGNSKEPEGEVREPLSEEDRKKVAKRNKNKRLGAKIKGKRSYQEKYKKKRKKR